MDFMTLAMMSEYKASVPMSCNLITGIQSIYTQVHFTLRDGNFALRAEGDQLNDTLILIPWGLLWHDLPSALVQDQVHWLNLSMKIIEIRPIEQPWKESPDNWRIDCTSE